MADEPKPSQSGLPEIDIPDFKNLQKKKEEEKKKKGGAVGWGGAAARGGAAAMGSEGAGGLSLFARLLSLVPGMAGASGPMLAMMGLAGLLAVGAAVSSQSGKPKHKKAPKVAVGDVDVKDSASTKQDSSLGLLSGANAGAGMFEEDKPKKKEEKKEEAPAKPDASADQPQQGAEKAAAVQEAPGAPSTPAQDNSNPFGGKSLASGKFGSLSGGFGGGGGGLGKFGPAGISKDGINGAFKNPMGGGGGKAEAMKSSVASHITRVNRRESATGSALRRAAKLSNQAMSEPNSNAASYTAQQAFEPGPAASELKGPKGGDGAGENTPTTPGMLGSGGGGGGGGGGPKAIDPGNLPTADTRSPWSDMATACMVLSMVGSGLMLLAGILANIKPWGLAAAMVLGVAAAACGAAMCVMGGIIMAKWGQNLLGGMHIIMGGVIALFGVLTVVMANAASKAADAAEEASKTGTQEAIKETMSQAASSATRMAVVSGVSGLATGIASGVTQGVGQDTKDHEAQKWREDNKP